MGIRGGGVGLVATDAYYNGMAPRADIVLCRHRCTRNNSFSLWQASRAQHASFTIWLLLFSFCALQLFGVAPSFPGYEQRMFGQNGKVSIWTLSFARRGDTPSTMCEWSHFDEAGYKFYLQKPHAIRPPTSPDSCWPALPDGLTFGDDYRGCYLFKRLSEKNYRMIDAGCSGEKSWGEFVNDETRSALFFKFYNP